MKQEEKPFSFRIMGGILGIGFMLLALVFRENAHASSFSLFFAGALVFIGAMDDRLVNSKKRKARNEKRQEQPPIMAGRNSHQEGPGYNLLSITFALDTDQFLPFYCPI